MTTPRFKTEERLRNPGLIALLALMTLLLANHLFTRFTGSWYDIGVSSLIALIIIGGWYAVFSTRLRIKVSRKYLKVRAKGPIGHRIKLAKKDMVDCTFIDVKPSARWSGALTHPASDFQCIDFGGRGGLYVSMRDGRSYFIGSDDLFAQRHDIRLPTTAIAS